MYERMYNYYFLSTSKRKFDIINSLNLDNYIYIYTTLEFIYKVD